MIGHRCGNLSNSVWRLDKPSSVSARRFLLAKAQRKCYSAHNASGQHRDPKELNTDMDQYPIHYLDPVRGSRRNCLSFLINKKDRPGLGCAPLLTPCSYCSSGGVPFLSLFISLSFSFLSVSYWQGQNGRDLYHCANEGKSGTEWW